MTENQRVNHMELQRDPRYVSRAREFFAEVALGAALSADQTEIGCLAVSELVTNAIVHGAEPMALTAVLEPHRLKVLVADGSDEAPSMTRHVSVVAEGGRGLMIVESLTDRWGWDRSEDGQGKTIWFEIRRDG
ncbi:MAG: ATP-binding protein [Acidimicrobiia bacterium]|nr:ATP-binding protein [Acidimicrobiia bacterium]